jgi:hypothetical protein
MDVPMPLSLIAFLFLVGGVFSAPAARAGALRIALPDSAVVRGDSIILADLLPLGTPSFLKDATKNVNLGKAPQGRLTRRLSRSVVLAALSANGLEKFTLEIPEFITLRRATHLVTRSEILAAIRQAESEHPDFPELRLEDISFDPVVLPDRPSQLEVTNATYDELIGRARFRLRSKSAPEVRPFYVTAQLPMDSFSSSFSSLHISMSQHVVPASAAPAAKSPVLVDPTRLARLHLHSSVANIYLQVKPLQRGHLGEIIRVRLPSNGKTLRAQVMEGGSLDAVL